MNGDSAHQRKVDLGSLGGFGLDRTYDKPRDGRTLVIELADGSVRKYRCASVKAAQTRLDRHNARAAALNTASTYQRAYIA